MLLVSDSTVRTQLKAIFCEDWDLAAAELAALLNGISPLRPTGPEEGL